MVVDYEGDTARQLQSLSAEVSDEKLAGPTVSRTSLGVVALQNTSRPSEASICDATKVIRMPDFPELCMRVFTLSNGIDA